MGKNIAIIILSLMLVISLAGNALLGAAFWAALQANALFSGGYGSLQAFSFTENYPTSVSQGDSFAITLDVTNITNSPQQVYEIDVSGMILDGIRVDSVSPSPTQVNNHHTPGGGGFIEYMFSHSLPASQTQTFTFNCTATQAGTWSGTLDIYDPNFAMESRFVQIDVK